MMPRTLSRPPGSDARWDLSETNGRSLAKTLSWRITGSGATFLISWFISGSWAMAGTIAMTQIMANTMLYYLHERVWNIIKWGRS